MYSYDLEGFKPGWIFILPPYSTVLDDPDWHPHYLLSLCAPQGQGTLAMGTSQQAEIKCGAPHHTIRPQIGGVRDNALEKVTHFLPVALVRMEHGNLPRPEHRRRRGTMERPTAARAAKELAGVRAAFRQALGIRPGPKASRPGARPWRGAIVALNDAFYENCGVRFAVVLTDPAYSIEEHYQIVLPLLAGDGMESDPNVVLRVAKKAWIQPVLGPHVREALLPVIGIVSVWHEDQILDDTGYELDQDTLKEVDQLTVKVFELETKVAAEG